MLTVSAADLEQTFGYRAPRGYGPRYNIAPSQTFLTLTGNPGAAFGGMTWGFVPSGGSASSSGRRIINARAETVAKKPAFRSAFESRRCLVVIDGYYEWQQGDRIRHPYRVCLSGREPFTVAAIWEPGSRGESQSSGCAILTTAAAPSISRIHERMPVIVVPEWRQRWLSGETSLDELGELMAPYDRADLDAYEVSPLVNSPANDMVECIAPFDAAAVPLPESASSRSPRRGVSSEVLDLFSTADSES